VPLDSYWCPSWRIGFKTSGLYYKNILTIVSDDCK
jgi:hypothetical protein